MLKLALRPRRGELLETLRRSNFVASTHAVVPVQGVPGVEELAFFAWPEPLGKTRRIAVDVVRVDQMVLPTPVSFAFELSPAERPEVPDEMPEVTVEADAAATPRGRPPQVRIDGPSGTVVWTLVDRPGREREVQRLEADGTPVFATVDTAVYCYRLTCPRCGRVRYSKPNSLHQVFYCRPCGRLDRLRYRALAQYRSRHGVRRRRG